MIYIKYMILQKHFYQQKTLVLISVIKTVVIILWIWDFQQCVLKHNNI